MTHSLTLVSLASHDASNIYHIYDDTHLVPAIWQEQMRMVAFPFLPQFIPGKENQQMLRSLCQFITRKLKEILTFLTHFFMFNDLNSYLG